MNSSLYFNLAKTNLRKNSKTYFPYILACISAIIMFYTMNYIVLNEGLDKIRSVYTLKMLLSLVGMYSISRLALAIAATALIFAVMYAVVYGLTAKTYYKIVQQEN